MNWINTRIVYSVIFYVMLMTLLVIAKPNSIFDRDGCIRPFGVGEDKTLFSMGVYAVVLAVMSFYVFCVIDLVFVDR